MHRREPLSDASEYENVTRRIKHGTCAKNGMRGTPMALWSYGTNLIPAHLQPLHRRRGGAAIPLM
jgi:hypothetical protein